MKILHLEDSKQDAELVQELVQAEWPDCEVICVATRFAYVGELHLSRYDLILSDFALPSINGLDALEIAKERAPGTPFIFLSGTIGEEGAIEAVRSGAVDYVLKDRPKRLVTAIDRALRESRERKQHRQAENRVRELGEFLHQAREAVIVTDLDGRITFWNQGAERISGWKAADVMEMPCSALFEPTTAAQLAAGCRAATEHGEWTGEIDLCDRQGQSRLIELRITLVRDDGGRPRARLALGTEITERRAAERRVREQAEMLDQAREAILITDLSNCVIYWNTGAERLFGWRSDEVLGKTLDNFFVTEVAAPMQAARDETLIKGEWQGEMRTHNRLQEALIVESRQTLIRDEAGQPKAQLSINSDITGRKRLEEQFLRAQRMENIGLLAAGIAHDLNNMLAPILLAAPMLRETINDPGGLSLLNTLEKSAERGANLVRQILAFAQGASGEPRLMQVRHLIRDITSIITATFPKNIRLEEFVPSDLWPIRGNATQIHQILLNWSVNARDAMPNGGTLHVRAANRVLDEAAASAIKGGRPGAFIVVEVEDTGTGIPSDVLKQMWDPFFTTKEVGKGTGLGLSTVRGIVEQHAGFTSVTTAPGKGSCFRAYLPAAEGQFDYVNLSTGPVPRGKGELILVVDDEKHIREMTATMLTRSGYRAILAADGAEAAALFAERAAEIRLVISDVQMPNLDGAMLGRALRRINPATKMLFVSGLSSTDSPRAPQYDSCESMGPFLHKPFKPEALLKQVTQLLNAPRTGTTVTPFTEDPPGKSTPAP